LTMTNDYPTEMDTKPIIDALADKWLSIKHSCGTVPAIFPKPGTQKYMSSKNRYGRIVFNGNNGQDDQQLDFGFIALCMKGLQLQAYLIRFTDWNVMALAGSSPFFPLEGPILRVEEYIIRGKDDWRELFGNKIKEKRHGK